MLTLLKQETDRLRSAARSKEESKSSIKVLHAIVGALKNLSLAVNDRGLLGNLGSIDRVAALFEFEHLKPIHHSCLSILRNLCGGINDENVYRIITGLNPTAGAALPSMPVSSAGSVSPIGKLVSLVWKSTGENDTGIRNEGGRVVVNLIRAIHRTNGTNCLISATKFLSMIFDLNAITLVVQIVTGALLIKASQKSDTPSASNDDDSHEVHFNAPPSMGQVFPLVQNEGIVSLALLCASKLLLI